ncbi:putative F420-dependent oxidoreductase [Nonomuraea thailandensis]|uniref:F420-dependent oxidoreductase n=1 Tax=Nonomuraea thailandensis TaxID=1188745 RepID=A0A9X2G9J2_9ACTN|nr:TIGR03619 family F420-dependent LLM class oxidoreductase [Nonomuraea thailandensis]MCP2353555.1 putative F420-dependent oxidoreductase [Nonomuraea thailandensis]
MKFGLNLPNFGADADPQSLLSWALRAEQYGFHTLMVSDHVALTPQVQAGFPAPFYEPLTTLSWLAGSTSRIQLGTTVLIVPYRHPLLTARVTANLDQLSGGRLILGVGAGWAESEFEALGVPFGGRGERTDEYLRIILDFWTGETVSRATGDLRFHQVATQPKPVQRPHPPIWVGGHSTRAIARAVRLGNAYHPTSVTMPWLLHVGIPQLRRIAEREGKAVPSLCPRIKLAITDHALDEESRRIGEGNVLQIGSDLSALAKVGAEYVIFDTTEKGQDRRPGQSDADWATIDRLVTKIVDLDAQGLR